MRRILFRWISNFLALGALGTALKPREFKQARRSFFNLRKTAQKTGRKCSATGLVDLTHSGCRFRSRRLESRRAAKLAEVRGIILTAPMFWKHHESPYDFTRFTKYGIENLLDQAVKIASGTITNSAYAVSYWGWFVG